MAHSPADMVCCSGRALTLKVLDGPQRPRPTSARLGYAFILKCLHRAARIRAFQFRDIRPKAASEMASLADASSLIGHSDTQITKRVYRRAGESVKQTK